MIEYTHICVERGNGLPGIGDCVIVDGDFGDWSIHRVDAVSSIRTSDPMSGNGNYLFLALGDEIDPPDDDEEAAGCWDTLHHVGKK